MSFTSYLSIGDSIVAQQVKSQLAMPASHIRVLILVLAALLPIQNPDIGLRKLQVMNQVLGFLPPIQKMRMKFLAHSFSLDPAMPFAFI